MSKLSRNIEALLLCGLELIIGAILSIIFALLIIFNPFASTSILWTFIAVSLIIEAIVDILTFIFNHK